MTVGGPCLFLIVILVRPTEREYRFYEPLPGILAGAGENASGDAKDLVVKGLVVYVNVRLCIWPPDSTRTQR